MADSAILAGSYLTDGSLLEVDPSLPREKVCIAALRLEAGIIRATYKCRYFSSTLQSRLTVDS